MPPQGGYGYEPPSPPMYGYPPPMGGYPVQQGTNGMAIAALVCALAGPFLCGIPTILGLIFGFLGLSQIKTSGQQGRGLAIAGIVISAVTLVAGIILSIALVALNQSESRHRHQHDDDYYNSAPAAAMILPRLGG
ncbi:hypothetical protein Mkiyose1665_22310 [Mycobacterium kiyosense]|uniref:DUF4190 domain-containing protein n=2 Tax=Mycobacteriaceae TaxID=1762 RepID=A0A9P3UX22_9MYCO|nr:hypothetical protein IWGMT90018_07340 [Mycobacterium kiyosense]BDE12110.1 hypothetical protein MKCMC460_09700 [Mycobacterium sp. 20KCMC460]GLB83865.1 hypothetical protein SRL2020028_31210 [Mycobacterium kiyosense]GLB88735.1 hypothetical protein SRL2020130_15520 [Mycobacterium kiyosense]GLB94995.1 hypothetical protein SRL2020226_17710 [Mycobacterium kiyosense]